MIQTKTIRIPYQTMIERDSHGTFKAYPPDHIDAPMVYAGSESRARKEIATSVKRAIQEALTAIANRRQYMIGANDGTVFLVQFKFGSWCYEICGADRKYACSASGFKDDKEATHKAKQHIESAFGGVAWEHAL